MTAIEVFSEGQKARLFRFAEIEVTIGYHADAILALEPYIDNGPELAIHIPPDRASMAKPTRQPGSFHINGTPCAAEVPIKTGDVITTQKYQITIRHLPMSSPAPDPIQPVLSEKMLVAAAPVFVAEAPSAIPAATVVAKQPPVTVGAKSGLSYLFLFFAPIKEFLEDDEVSEVLINGPRQIYVERKGKLTPVNAQFAGDQALQAAVMNVARSVGRFFDRDNPRLDARLPDGSRVHAVMPPVSRLGTIVAIRKFRREKLTIGQLTEFGSISPDGARLLEMIVNLGKNLIVSGATSSGKTSVLNVLSGFIPATERILVLEDASELQLQQAHVVSFEARKPDEHGKGEVSIRDLLHSALRLRPDRLVLGEIRSGEALDLLQAMNTGHDGSMSTIHANSARDSLLRLETCALLSGIEIPLSALREQVAAAVHIVVQTARLFDGTRKITAISEVLGLQDHKYQLQDILLFKQDSISSDGKIEGRHVFTGYRPTFLGAAQHRGLDVAGLFP